MFLRVATFAALAVLSLTTSVAAEVCVEVDVRVPGPVPSSALLGSMTSEVDAIWKPYGVRIQWKGGVDTVRCPSIVWSFDVQVNDGFPPRSSARPVTLGTTWVGRLPASRRSPIHLDFAATRRLIGSLTAAQLDHAIGRFVDILGKLLLLGIQLTGIAIDEHFGKPPDGRQWCPQLV